MARARTARHPEPETPEETPAEGAAISKAEAVRQALAEGIDNPTDGLNFLRDRFGIEMKSTMWSSYAAQARARQRKKEGGESPRSGGDDAALELVEALKPLIDRFGAEKLIRWINVLS
jgi:hypothetical protein